MYVDTEVSKEYVASIFRLQGWSSSLILKRWAKWCSSVMHKDRGGTGGQCNRHVIKQKAHWEMCAQCNSYGAPLLHVHPQKLRLKWKAYRTQSTVFVNNFCWKHFSPHKYFTQKTLKKFKSCTH